MNLAHNIISALPHGSRVLLAGGPGVGKSTRSAVLATELGCEARHTDSLRTTFDWSGVSAEVATWFDAPGPWVIEGVAVPRALRKWLAAHPEGIPADVLYWGAVARVPTTPGQNAMAKGVATVWNEIRDVLLERGMRVELL
jgi:DNA polymerase III delta prime subunit